MNASLTREFTIEEVEAAVKEMAPLKAPGPDGMPPLFYQSYWSLVGSEVSQSILHYLNTDDSVIFCRAKESECQCLLDILAKYESASGQQINRTKTTLFFSKSTPKEMQTSIKDMLGVSVIQQYEKYLGLPSLVGRKKKESFTHIKQQVWKKLAG